MNSIMVRNESGYYQMDGAAEVENWDDVRAEADAVERVESLTGWGEYTAAYRVLAGGAELTYFVSERKPGVKLFRDDNTDGYTAEEISALNAEWEAKAQAEGLDEWTDEYNESAKAFSDEVASR